MPRVLITGANRGLGLEFARQYAAEGWCVLATSRSLANTDALQAVPGDVHLHALDVADPDAIEALARKLAPMSIDVVINNAGIFPDDRGLHDLDPAGWLEGMRINALAPMLVARAFQPHLEAGSAKTLASITSLMGSIGDNSSGGLHGYRMSKAALNMGMRSLGLDWAPRGLKVVLLHPGWVATNMGGPSAPMQPGESVAGMRRVIAGLTLEQSASFLRFNGDVLPW